jgi:hypothetical protein
LILLAFVVPLAVYSLILAYLNRHPHPVMVPGPWDFAGVLLAGSGLLLVGGPAILTSIYEQWRLAWLLGRIRFFQNLGENWYFWVGLWVGYFVFIVVGASWVLWRQRTKTSIYNVHPDVFMEVFLQACDRLDFDVLCSGHHLVLRVRPVDGKAAALPTPADQHALAHDPAMATEGTRAVAWQVETTAREWAALDWDPFPAMRHVTLHWNNRSAAIRQDVEEELARALTHVWTPGNPVGGWFLSIGLSLFAVILFTLLGLAVIQVLRLMR